MKGRIIDPAFLFSIAEWGDRAARYRLVGETARFALAPLLLTDPTDGHSH